ncbi:DNA-binding proteins Bright/BRCAA1/RBP1 and proteins containing BRIGHT domain [Vermiconidia calcicola]|uniref:DNA-binding proteins Bright/BRCAA1/RBP1 and proteins containing BRIGHT domain n=1 Tax=Vermiconidia calcicola TaxID=1690605 RepID=A0AAV9QMZ0_9PEZI|nr:DNA-binding proteins Bright/BRCAA1/RBP1 and proteins containing BRIGHT domain [Exophiala xenobiotica]KAK5545047.1 DNA-binding proteins Bright/BRCAA1/RBP1 and proteins containing BRIGHT domain [Vermiconidia calcicola]
MPPRTSLTQRVAGKPQAGRMSRDGDRSEYVPILADVPLDYGLGEGDTTDEEDWPVGHTPVNFRPPGLNHQRVDESEHEDEGKGEDEDEDEGEEEAGAEDEEDGVYLSKDLKIAPKPTDFVVDDEDEEVEEQEQEVGKKRKRSTKAYIPNSTTLLDRQNFLNSCPIPKELSALLWIERQHRLMKYELRLKSILESLQHSAQTISWENFRTGRENGMTVGWWHFLFNMSIKLVLPMLLKAAPETVCLVLGGPLSRKELLLLPAKWKAVTLFGIYLDVVTGETVENDDAMEGYVGSATGATGLNQRLSRYPAVNNRTCKPDPKSAHERLISLKGSNINLRVLAVFDAASTSRPYVMLSELCHTILLQTWEDRPGQHLSPACIDLMRAATPKDIAVKKFKGLNRASQLQQALSAPRKGRFCDNCKRQDPPQYSNAIRGLAFQTIICQPCAMYQNSHGKPRPAELEQRRAERGPKPADGKCGRQDCDRPVVSFNRHLQVWTCIKHRMSTTIVREPRKQRSKTLRDTVPKSADGQPAKCGRPGCDRRATNFNNHMQVWTCRNHSRVKSFPSHKSPANKK